MKIWLQSNKKSLKNQKNWKIGASLAFSILFALTSLLGAAEAVTAQKLNVLLGENYTEIFSDIGLPVQMFPVRQKDEVMDDIVMVYETVQGPFYLYFYNNNFYRVLIPSVSKADFYGVKIGDSLSQLKGIYGDQLEVKDGYAHYIDKDNHYIFNIEKSKIKNIWMILEGKPEVSQD